MWTTPTYDAATNTIFVSTGTLNDHTQTQSQAIVALNATTLQYESSWQLPFEASVLDSDWGTTPTLTTDSAGDQLLSVANKNGILYTFNRNNLAAGPDLAEADRHRRRLPDLRGRDDRVRHLRERRRCTTPAAATSQNGHGSGGSITAFNPGTGDRPVEPPDRGADPRLARLRQRDDRRGGGHHLRGAQRRQRGRCCTPT